MLESLDSFRNQTRKNIGSNRRMLRSKRSKLSNRQRQQQYYRYPTYVRRTSPIPLPSHHTHSLLFPTILPARTIHAPLCLHTRQHQYQPRKLSAEGEQKKSEQIAYLFTDPLPAVLAFHGMLDNGIIGRPSIHKCNGVESDTDADEVEHFVNEGTG